MKVKIEVEFEVIPVHHDSGEIKESQANYAAELAQFEHAVFTDNGLDTVGSVIVHVDGFGECKVRMGDT